MIRILIGSVHSTAIQSLGRFPNGFSFVTHVDFMYTWYKTIFIKLIWPTHDLKEDQDIIENATMLLLQK